MHTWFSCCYIPSRCTLATNSMWYQITKEPVLPCDRWRTVLILSEVSWQCTQYRHDLSRPHDNISWSTSTLFFVAVLFLRVCKFLQLHQRQCNVFMPTTFNRVLSLLETWISKYSGNHTSQYPACNSWNYWSVVESWVSQGRHQETQECHKAPFPMFYAVFMRIGRLSRGHVAIDWGWPQ